MNRKSITIEWVNSSQEMQILSVKFSDNDYIQKGIMQAGFISLNFSLPYYIEIPIGAYIEENNEKYYLLDLCQPTKYNSENFEYSFVFYDIVGMFSNWIVQPYAEDDNRIKFSLTARPYDFLQMIVTSCNKHISSSEILFTIGDYEDTTEQMLSFDSTNVMDALNNIAEIFNTEWYITTDMKLCLKKQGNGNTGVVTIQYGSGCGIKPNIERKNYGQRKIDRLFVQGGNRNIIPSKYNNQQNLLLPKSTVIYYDGVHFHNVITTNKDRKYITDNEGIYITSQSYNSNKVHADMGFNGENIYPKRVGQITAVTWSPNNSQTECDTYEEAKSLNSNNEDAVWCNIYDTTIPNDLDFFDDDVRAEGTETIYFQTGRLAGREIEVSTYNHNNREFKLMQITDGGEVMPNSVFTPDIGDEYIVYGMMMPQNYVDSASKELLEEAVKKMYECEIEQVVFTLPIDEIWYKNQNQLFNVGDYIFYKDKDFAEDGLTIRISQIKTYLSNPYKIELTLNNCIKRQTKIKFVNNRPPNWWMQQDTGSVKNTAFFNKCWTVKPFPPYTKDDEWLVTENINIGEYTFKAGVTYLCLKTRLLGTFEPLEWRAKSISKYDNLDNLPKLNDVTITGNIDLADNKKFIVLKDDVATKMGFKNLKELPDKSNYEKKTMYLIPTVVGNKKILKSFMIDDISGEMLEVGDGNSFDLSSLLYSKTYDMTDPQLNYEDITATRMDYDNTLNMFYVTGKVYIRVPRKSSYSLSLTIYDNFKEAYITANNIQYSVQTSMTIPYEDVDVIEFVTEGYLWLQSITVMETTFPDIPTKLSQLENDQRFIASEVIEQNETIKLIIKEKQE